MFHCRTVRFAWLLLLVTLSGLATSPQPAIASASSPHIQVAQEERHIRVGVLTLGTLEALEPGWGVFVQRLAESGYVEGQNLTFEPRAAGGDATRLPELAADLVALEPDVIFAAFTPAILAAKQAAPSISIVIPYAGDPVGTGLVDSFDHPGGNVTGMSDPSSEQMPGLVRVLHETIPGGRRLAVFTPPANSAIEAGLEASRALGQQLGVEILRVPVEAPTNEALDAAFATAVAQGGNGFIFYYTPTTPALDRHAAELAAQHHLPGAYQLRGPVDAGGLMSRTVDYKASFARTADYAVQILDGADPAELPVGVPENFELVINLKAADALGLTMPPDLLEQATEIVR